MFVYLNAAIALIRIYYYIQTMNGGKMYSYFLRNHWKLVESFVCAYMEIIIIQMHCWSYNNVC